MTDEGGEFVSKSFSNFLKSKNISFWTTNNREIKASLAERFIRTLRNKILRHFTANKTQNWTKILANIVKHYNNSYHNSLKMPPSKVTWKNSTQIRRILYPKLTEKQRNYNEKMKNRFYVGRSVRLLRIPGSIFTKEVFTVSKHIKRRILQIEIIDKKGQPIQGRFYPNELSPI